MRKGRKSKVIVEVRLSTENPLEARIVRAIEELRQIQIADMLYVSGSELVKTLALKGLVMIEREYPNQFEAGALEVVDKPTLVKKKRVAHERADKSALDLWGGATT